MKQTAFTLLATLLSSTAAWGQQPAPVVVDLRGAVQVASVEVQLEDIAEISGGTATDARAVSSTNLGSAPAPGYSRVFRADRVLSAIGKQNPGVEVRMRGQRACRVHPSVETIGPSTLIELARERVQAEFEGEDVELTLLGETRAVAVPAGNRGVEARVREGELAQIPTGVNVPVDVHVDGSRYRTVWIAWKVTRWGTQEVLARPVRRGETLTLGHFERQRVPIDASSEKVLLAETLAGATALRDMLSGEPVTALDVHRPTVVSLGDTVFLEVRSRGISARVPAVSLGVGAVGDRIRVRTLASKQELMATVKSRDLCRIDLHLPRDSRRQTTLDS